MYTLSSVPVSSAPYIKHVKPGDIQAGMDLVMYVLLIFWGRVEEHGGT